MAGEGDCALVVRTTNFWAPCLTAIVRSLSAQLQLAGEEVRYRVFVVVALKGL